MLKYFRYYINIILSKFKRNYIIQYTKHMSSNYFNQRRHYARTVVHTVNESQNFIAEKIEEGNPMAIARFGSTELYNLEVFDMKIQSKYENALGMLCQFSGFFPKEINLAFEFAKLMKESCEQIDCLGIWNMFMEEHYIKKCMPKSIYLTQLRFLEPWFSDTPWTYALKGKKVLVIHPFVDTIRNQYEKRNKLFADAKILPDFDLYTLRAVQTIAGEKDDRFITWFEALDYMYNEAMKIDFDVALIGCGAYGFPLAAKLKKSGKQAIHMGGVLQILFGIKGKRWEDDPVVSKLFNDEWCYPDPTETPQQAKKIEGGCYW